MRRSIRWRLQAWYALVLLAVVAGLAAVLYEEVRRGRYAKVDADLLVLLCLPMRRRLMTSSNPPRRRIRCSRNFSTWTRTRLIRTATSATRKEPT